MLENYMRFLHSAPHRSWTNIQQAVSRLTAHPVKYGISLYLAIKCSDLFHISINCDIPLSTFASLIHETPLCLCYVYFAVTLQLNSLGQETTTEELEAQVMSGRSFTDTEHTE